MRFVTFEAGGHAHPGLVLEDNTVVDLAGAGFHSMLQLIEAGAEGRAKVEKFAAGAPKEKKHPLESVKLLAPIPPPA